MLDLDSLDQLKSGAGPDRLYVQFAQWLCMEKITYAEFQKLSKWTNTYHYILPMDRKVDSNLCDVLYNLHRDKLFCLALLVSHIESNLKPEHQSYLLELLTE